MHQSPMKHAAIKVKKVCNTSKQLESTQTKRKKSSTHERLRRTRMYSAFLAEAFASKENSVVKDPAHGLLSTVEEKRPDGPSSIPIPSSSSSSQEDCGVHGAQQDKHWTSDSQTSEKTVQIDDNSFDRNSVKRVTSTELISLTTTRNDPPGKSNTNYVPVSSKSKSITSSGNRLKQSSGGNIIPTVYHQTPTVPVTTIGKHTDSRVSITRKKRNPILSGKPKVNSNLSNMVELQRSGSIVDTSSKQMDNKCALQGPQTSPWHTVEEVKKSLNFLANEFGFNSHVLWQCKFCTYKNSPLRVKHHVAIAHLGVEANEHNFFDCPHCYREFDSEVTLRCHLKRVHSLKGWTPCPHCPATVRQQTLRRHILDHINAKKILTSTGVSTLKTKQITATEHSSITFQSANPSKLVMRQSEMGASTPMQCLGSDCMPSETQQISSAKTVKIPFNESEQSTLFPLGQLRSTTSNRHNTNKKLAAIPQSKSSSKKSRTPSAASTSRHENQQRLSNLMLQQPIRSKVNLEAVSIIYQSIQDDSVDHCPMCLFSSCKPVLLKHLLEKHLTADSNRFGEICCPHCGYICFTHEEYSLHLLTSHNTLYPCVLCSTVLPQLEDLIKHLLSHIQWQLEAVGKENITRVKKGRVMNNRIDAKSLHNVYISARLLKHEHGILKCPLCVYCTPTNPNFFRHLGQAHLDYVRNQTNLIQCSHCRKAFSCRKTYRSHLRVNHSNHSSKFPCQNCSLHFSAMHQEEAHLGKHLQPSVRLVYLKNVFGGAHYFSANATSNKENKQQEQVCVDVPRNLTPLTEVAPGNLTPMTGVAPGNLTPMTGVAPGNLTPLTEVAPRNLTHMTVVPPSNLTPLTEVPPSNLTHMSVVAEHDSTSDCDYHCCHCLVTEGNNKYSNKELLNQHGFCSCTTGEGSAKQEPCLCRDHSELAEVSQPVTCCLTDRIQNEVLLEHATCSFKDEALEESLQQHGASPCSSVTRHEETAQHVTCFKAEQQLNHDPCSCSREVQQSHSEHHCTSFSLAVVCPLCSLSCMAFGEFFSHLRKAHQDERGCHYCSLCHHTEQDPARFELHVLGHMSSYSGRHLPLKDLANLGHCFDKPMHDES